jgi:RNA polymerase sigma-70 factor (ECF subfamily)
VGTEAHSSGSHRGCLSLLYRPATATPLPPDEDAELLRALRAGDEHAFAELVAKYGPSLLRLAQLFVSSRAVAEDVVAETWLAVYTGLERFEGRSSLKTWLFRILTNKAKTRGQRESRTVPFSALAVDGDEGETAVDVDRFLGPDSQHAGAWAIRPRGVPEERLLALEARERIEAAIEALPPNQRAVITLRDVEGLSAEEACNVLGVSETNQRVLLHRARSKVRAAFERYLEEAE